MGANISNFDHDDELPKSSGVLSFNNSNTNWKALLDAASKENDKLVKMGGNISNFNYVDAPPKSAGVLFINSTAKWNAHFAASKYTDKLMVIDFFATWCGPCRQMNVTIREFSAKYTDVEFIKIDVDELMDVAKEFKVQGMPTFILMKRGKVLDKLVGAKKDELQKLIEKHRN